MPLETEERQSTILIVDDVPENLDVLKDALRPQFIVQPALSGELALKIARTEPGPDLILLDVMMPGMDGYEVLRQLKKDARTSNIPVIFVTANDEVANQLQGFELGAVDYITKPYSVPVVQARLKTHLALQSARRRILEQNRTLIQERELVESIIACMRKHRDFDPRHLSWLLSPVDTSNGDILFSASTPDGRQWLLVGDVAGHGMPAAVVSPLVSHIFYSQARAGGDIQSMLSLLNEVMHRQLPIGLFMAACAAEVAVDRSHFRLWNAGMPAALLLRQGQVCWRGEPRILPPFGICGDIDYLEGRDEKTVAPGDRLCLFSDGLTEVWSPDRVQFGIKGVESLLCSAAAGADLSGLLLEALERHHGSRRFCDDITFLELQF